MSMTTGVPAPTRARMQTLEAVRTATGGVFDADAWHVMDARDNQLIADEILHGAGSSKFVYEFDIQGKRVTGISVIGARHLASIVGGIKHRLVGCVQKVGALHTFTSFPAPGMPMCAQVQVIQELRDEEDYYSVVVEVSDVKTGNMLQVEARENRYEERKNGGRFDRPNYPKIAQAKAFRNGVLAVVAQDVQLKWKLEMLKLGKTEVITSSVIDEKRAGILRFAAAKSLTVDRTAVEALTFQQIAGLSDAAGTGIEAFQSSAVTLGVMAAAPDEVPALQASKPAERPRQEAKPPAEGKPPAAAKLPPFRGYLADETGELQGEAWQDPVAYARQFNRMYAASADRAALIAANQQTLDEASAASVPARAVLDEGRRAPAAEPGQAAQAVAVEQGRNGPSWTQYLRDLRTSLNLVGATQLDAWAALNLPTIVTAPDSYRLQVVKLVTDHAVAVGGRAPEGITAAVQRSPDTKAADADRVWLDGMLRDVLDAPTAEGLSDFLGGKAVYDRMQKLERERPELHKELSEAIAARIQELDAPSPEYDGFPGDRPLA